MRLPMSLVLKGNLSRDRDTHLIDEHTVTEGTEDTLEEEVKEEPDEAVEVEVEVDREDKEDQEDLEGDEDLERTRMTSLQEKKDKTGM